MVTITLDKLHKYIDKLKNSQFKKSNISSYYLIKPVSNENKKYYSLLFKNSFSSIEWLEISKNTNIVIKYSIEIIVKEPINIMVFLGIKDNEKMNIIKTSKNIKKISITDNKICDVILYNPTQNEKLCLIIKMPQNIEISNNSIITMIELFY